MENNIKPSKEYVQWYSSQTPGNLKLYGHRIIPWSPNINYLDVILDRMLT